MLKNVRCLRRIYHVVVLLAVACILILCFQFFLFGALNVYSDVHDSRDRFDRGARPKYTDDERGFEETRHLERVMRRITDIKVPTVKTSATDCKENNCSGIADASALKSYQGQVTLKDNIQYVKDDHVLDSLVSYKRASATGQHRAIDSKSFVNVWQYLEQLLVSSNEHIVEDAKKSDSSITNIRGANLKWQQVYQMDDNGYFTCILSQEKIHFSRVNDDYCDCIDHSDEPGTSSCSNGRFYCSFQSIIHSKNPKWLPSSRVNDGLCDCCDGSDEWKNHTLPGNILHNVGVAHYNIYQAPCVDRCDQLRRQELKLAELKLHGLSLKRDYVEAGLGRNNPDNLYGTNAEFYKLRSMCVDVRSGKYSYSVCPFGPIKQTDSGHSVVIGSSPKWLDQGPIVYRLVLNDGDSTNCPESQSRKTTIVFECGIEDHVVSVSESEVCQYLIRFTSPAAC